MGNLPSAPANYDLIELMFGEVHNVKDRPKGWASKKVGDLNAISEL